MRLSAARCPATPAGAAAAGCARSCRRRPGRATRSRRSSSACGRRRRRRARLHARVRHRRGGDRGPLRVERGRAARGAGALPGARARGAELAIDNVAPWRGPGWRAHARVDAAAGPGRRAARAARCARPAIYVPGGRAPYPSTVVMGAVTARAAGRRTRSWCAAAGADGEIDPVDPRRVRRCAASTRSTGWAAPRRSPRWRTGPRRSRRVDVIVGPGNVYVRRPSASSPAQVGIDGFAGPERAGGRDRRRPADRARSWRSTCCAQAEHGAGQPRRRPSRPTRRVARRARGASSPSGARATSAARRRARRGAATGRGARARRSARARAPPAVGARRRGAGAARAHAGCLFVGPRERDRVRRLRRGLQPRAADGRRRPLRLGARRRGTSAAACAEVRVGDAGGSSRARAPRSRAPRASSRTRESMEARIGDNGGRIVSRTQPTSTARTKETDVQPDAGARRRRARARATTGVGFLDHMLDLLARHGRLDLDVQVDGRPRDRRATTRSRTSAICSARRSTRRSATGAASSATGTRVVPMDEALATARSTSRAGRSRVRGRAAAGLDRRLRPRAGRGVLPRGGQRGEAHAAPARRGRHQRAPHDRGGVQGVRARAARGGRDRPERDRRAEHEGDADV